MSPASHGPTTGRFFPGLRFRFWETCYTSLPQSPLDLCQVFSCFRPVLPKGCPLKKICLCAAQLHLLSANYADAHKKPLASGGWAQAVECWPSKPKSLNSNPSTTKNKNKKANCQALVAHACNPSYSGGRDQEDCGSRSAWGSSS
jgi:hypothetical protein